MKPQTVHPKIYFNFLERVLGLVSLSYFVHGFSRKCFVWSYFINWSNFIVWLSFFYEIKCVYGSSKSTFVVEGARGSLKSKRKRTKRGESSLSGHSLWEKIVWCFKQQAEFFLISCLAVTKIFAVLSLVQHTKAFLY